MSLPKTIKAIGIKKNGDLDVIEELTLPFPEAKENELVVKVEYGGVNYIDTYERAGLYPTASFPKPLGKEAAGTIVKLPTSSEVLDDPEYKLRGFAVGDSVALDHTSTFGQYITTPWIRTIKLPPNVTARDGAVVLLQGLTAITIATEAHEIKKGQTVVIYSAAGGVGILLMQIALHKGATVIATVSSNEKAEFVRKLGAQHIINSTTQSVVDEVLRITNGEGAEGIFDGIGKDTFADAFVIAKRKGTIVTYGNASGPPPAIAPLKLGEKNLKLCRPRMNNYTLTAEEFRTYADELFDLVAKGILKPEVHKEYPFSAEGVKESQKDITSRGTIGKLLIKVA